MQPHHVPLGARVKKDMAFFQKIYELRSPKRVDNDFINDNVFEEKVKDQNQESLK